VDPQTPHSPGAAEPVASPPPAPARGKLAELGFRFCLVYFSLYIFFGQMLRTLLLLPVGELPEFGASFPMRHLVTAVARHGLGIEGTLVVTHSGSGDKIYDWVQVGCLLGLALLLSAAWLVRRPAPPERLTRWVLLIFRLAVGATMISYGMVKAIPLQMPAPQLTRLIEPFGNFSPMGVLWYSVGASRPYEILIGCAELLAGVLLFLPRTATLGALVCLADAIQIFALNMTYDVPVKLFSFHLILFSLFLLAPEASRLAGVLLLDRPVAPSTQPPLLRSRRGNRWAVLCQAVFGIYLICMNLYSALYGWSTYGGGAPKSPLYGIWDVAVMKIDGQLRSPLVTDFDRYRRVVFQTPVSMALQRMDDTMVPYTVAIDVTAGSLVLTRATDKSWRAAWSFRRPTAEQLILDGDLDGHKLHLELQRLDHRKFLLLSRGFHWFQDYPFNR
jgi:uncharacterized membrane protein YphA (DoxX/SURF4 family)